jgi:sn-glycerol 3-phosphate transport system substrate-binding protein
VTVTVWGTSDEKSVRGKWFIDKLKEFQTNNPTIKVEYTAQGGYDGVANKLLTGIVGNNLPTMAQMEESLIAQYNTICTDLSGYLSKEKIDDINPGLAASCYWGGKLLAIPSNRSEAMMYCNKTLLEKAGLDVTGPKTWDELYQFAAKMTDKGAGTYGFGALWDTDAWFWESALYSNGGQVVSDDGTKVTFNDNQAGTKIIALYQKMAKEGSMFVPFGRQGDAEELVFQNFVDGKIGMIITSSGDYGTLKKKGMDFITCFQPKGEKYSVVTGGANWIVCNTASEDQKKAAAKIIEFLTTPENCYDFYKTTGYMPATKSALDMPEMKKLIQDEPNFKNIIDQLQYAHKRPQTKNWREMYTYLVQKLEESLLKPDQIDPQKLMDEAQVKCQSIIDSNK